MHGEFDKFKKGISSSDKYVKRPVKNITSFTQKVTPTFKGVKFFLKKPLRTKE